LFPLFFVSHFSHEQEENLKENLPSVDLTKAIFTEFREDIAQLKTGDETEFDIQQFIEALDLGAKTFFTTRHATTSSMEEET
jgi:hypothetical protein